MVSGGFVARDASGEGEFFGEELEPEVFGGGAGHLGVFAWVDAAGGVEDGAAGVQVRGSGFEEVTLEGGEAFDLSHGKTDTGFGPAGEGAAVAAGDVEEDQVIGRGECLGVPDDADAVVSREGG